MFSKGFVIYYLDTIIYNDTTNSSHNDTNYKLPRC